MTRECDPRRSCREGQERETEREPGLKATYLIGLASTIDPADWERVLPACCDLEAVVLTSLPSYLGARAGCRNEAAVTNSAIVIGTSEMTTFDKREDGFEKKFAHDEELKFKAEARRNKLLGLWVAEKLGMSGDAANDYAKTVVAADFEEAGDGDVVRKVMGDLAAKGVALTEPQLRVKMDELMAQAIVQVKAGT
jgi:hypothetical protein